MTEHAGAGPRDRDQVVLDGAFGCGYLILGGDGPDVPDLVRGWTVHRLGSLRYHLHPRARLHTVTRPDGPGRIVLLGDPADIDTGTVDGTRIGGTALDVWASGGLSAVVRYLAYLGGRWTAILEAAAPADGAGPAEITVVPDCQATQAVFYASRGGLAMGSQPALVAAATGSGPDEAAEQMLQDLRAARKRGVVFLPGTMTTHENVLPLVPNHLLRVRLGDATAEVTHERFWPFQDRVEITDSSRITREFLDYFREHTKLLCSIGRPIVSLTGGLDSRTTLAAALPHLHRDSFTFTYYNPRDGLVGEGAPLDVFTANALSNAVGVQHRVLRWRQPASDSPFAEIYDRTYPVRRGSTGAAHAMWADLPHDIIHLQSIGAELGTTFYASRPGVPITPQRLLEIVTGRSDLPEQMARDAFGDYLDYAQFSPSAIGGYDYHDVFYWEQRMGKWGYQKYQDGDFSHRMLMPFNARGLIEIMQSLPYQQRADKVLLHAMLATVPMLDEGRLPAHLRTTPVTPVPEPITWRDLVAARPHVRPRIRTALERVSQRDRRGMS